MKEEWRWIEGYEGKYEVSSLGRVRTYNLRVPKIMSVYTDARGYQRIHLRKGDGSKCSYWLHRLVGAAFCEKPVDHNEINHIDCNRTNNTATNLEWVTRAGNNQHAYKHGNLRPPRLFGERAPRSKLTEKQVIEIRDRYSRCSAQNNTVVLGKDYGVSFSTIARIVSNKTWTHI